MSLAIDENPVRKRIMLLLKKSGGMSVEELSRELGITPMGVRQHLAALEKKGLVVHNAVRQGVGRPGFVFRLSETADELFPRSYGKFAIEILRDIESRDGRARVDELFAERKKRMLAERMRHIGGNGPLGERVRLMVSLLEADGYVADADETGDEYILRQYNCPISAISRRFPEACKHELDMYRALFNSRVRRTRCLSRGENVCEYVVPKSAEMSGSITT